MSPVWSRRVLPGDGWPRLSPLWARKGCRKEKRTQSLQPEPAEQAHGVPGPATPRTVVSGCGARSASPSCLRLHLLGSHHALSVSHCVLRAPGTYLSFLGPAGPRRVAPPAPPRLPRAPRHSIQLNLEDLEELNKALNQAVQAAENIRSTTKQMSRSLSADLRQARSLRGSCLF